jgi:hypothetical protein
MIEKSVVEIGEDELASAKHGCKDAGDGGKNQEGIVKIWTVNSYSFQAMGEARFVPWTRRIWRFLEDELQSQKPHT